MTGKTWIKAACIALAASTGGAIAAPVTWGYEVTIGGISSDPVGLFAANGIGPGSVYRGTIVYDDTATNFDNGGNFDSWDLLSATTTIPIAGTFTRGGVQAAAVVGLQDRWSTAFRFDIPGRNFNVSLILSVRGDFGYNVGAPIDVGPGLGRPILPPPLAAATASSFDIEYQDEDDFDVSGLATGDVRFFDPVAQVPLPAGLPLLAGGLIGVAALGATRRRKGTVNRVPR